MSFKKLLVPVHGGAGDAVALGTALAMAKGFDAHVAAQFVHADVREAIPLGELPVSPDFVQDLIATTAQVETAAAAEAKDGFAAAAKAAGAPVTEAPQAGYSASFSEVTGNLPQTLCRASRLSDLAVFSRLDDGTGRDPTEAVARVLIKSPCPVLLLPESPAAVPGRRIAVGWDEEGRCARAMMAALPLLRRAEAVALIAVRADAQADEGAEEAIAYLKLHGIAAEGRVVAQNGRKIGEVLLEAAESSDMLVAGGYGRGRLTEALFGGVTDHLMSHAALPVFMAH